MHEFLYLNAAFDSSGTTAAPSVKRPNQRVQAGRMPKNRIKTQTAQTRRIKAALARKGLTQTEIAARLGLHLNTVTNAINHGLNTPTLERIKAEIAA